MGFKTDKCAVYVEKQGFGHIENTVDGLNNYRNMCKVMNFGFGYKISQSRIIKKRCAGLIYSGAPLE